MIFSPWATDHLQNLRNLGPLDPPFMLGVGGDPGGGPYMKLWVRREGTTIAAAAYKSNGCPSAIVCGSFLSEIIVGREVAVLRTLTPAELITMVGGLPDGKAHYADLAIRALKDAIGESE